MRSTILAVRVDAVHLKNILRQINANRRNLHGGRSPQFSGC
jgi:hypothetical protein